MKYNDVNFKKKFGQNFLKDESVVKRIVDVSGVDKTSLVIEVGPGGAILTKMLAQFSGNVLSYEIDFELKKTLFDKLKGFDNVDIQFKDFLVTDIKDDIKSYSYEDIYFVSNVPYYITTPIVMKLLNSSIKFKKIVMMVQKEVGERFTSPPGSRSYGSISVILNYFYDVQCEFFVGREEFIPMPNVDSVVVSFTPRSDRLKVKDFNFFERLVRDSFQFKRKNLRNNLKSYDLDMVLKVLTKYGLDLSVRAEELKIEIFVDIANALS